ncbi:hypothetical protein [Stutzerimonas nitrititolerans]|uniref:hypothetical protein n=1 Tax=Stutzerimonas nitrititolerans TaxID=2482751 RepID=UPI00289750E1|nr:hypothetical protein [Stutzerimonas nitrititolerans]
MVSSDLYVFLLLVGWGFSLVLIGVSLIKYKLLLWCDFLVIMSWFYIFLRPLYGGGCDINMHLYHWDEGDYYFGTLYSVAGLVIGQLFSVFPSGRITPRLAERKFENNFSDYQLAALLLSVFVVAVMYFIYGSQVYPENRGVAAISISLPGLEYFYHILSVTLGVVIVLCLFRALAFGELASYLIFFGSVSVLVLIFAKRGNVVAPILSALIVYGFYFIKIQNGSFLRYSRKCALFIIVVVFLAFFGKSLSSTADRFNIEKGSTSSFVCEIIEKGQQEFDLFWPAVISISRDHLNILDLPSALVGGVLYPHETRIALDSSFHSITDKAMLRYNYDAYVYSKFGISPDVHQFYYSYFGVFGMFLVAILSFFIRRLELTSYVLLFSGRVPLFFLIGLFISTLWGSFDIKLKYTVFALVIHILIMVAAWFVGYRRQLGKPRKAH